LKKKTLTLFILVFMLSLFSHSTIAAAENTLYPLASLSSENLTFFASEGDETTNSTMTIVGLAESKVSITLSTSTFYDESSANSVTFKIINTYVDRNETVLPLTIDIKDAKAGTYKGTIIVVARENETTTSTKISATVNIEKEKFPISLEQIIVLTVFLLPFFIGLVWKDEWEPKIKKFYLILILTAIASIMAILAIIVSAAFRPIIFTLVLAFFAVIIAVGVISLIQLRRKEFREDFCLEKKYVLVLTAMIVAAVFIYAIVTRIFGDLSLISGALVVPFIGYIIAYVKDKRDERKESIKTAITLRNNGIQKDLDFLRDILGETGKNYASLSSDYYRATGKLSRTKWEKSATQGIIADIPTGYLAKYYHYTDLYNAYYSAVFKIHEQWKATTRKQYCGQSQPCKRELNNCLVDKFTAFKKEYADLDKSIFAYVVYVIGLLGKQYLTPLEIEFPRLSRGLLDHLVEIKVLKPDNYGYKGDDELKESIKNLDDKLFDEILKNIYTKESQTKIKKAITENFNATYKKLEELAHELPPIPDDLKDKEKPNPQKIEAVPKIDGNSQVS
jgi:hypothetical protein